MGEQPTTRSSLVGPVGVSLPSVPSKEIQCHSLVTGILCLTEVIITQSDLILNSPRTLHESRRGFPGEPGRHRSSHGEAPQKKTGKNRLMTQAEREREREA